MATPSESESSYRAADAQARNAATFVYDATLAPAPFHGDGGQNAEEWLEYFQRYVAFKQLPHDVALPLFALLMRGPANTWFGALPEDDRESYTRATEAFQAKFGPTPLNKWKKASELWSRTQSATETVEKYVAEMLKRAKECDAADDMTRYAIVHGLRPELRAYVLQQGPTSTTALLEAAKIAEATIVPVPTVSDEILEAIRRLEMRSTAPMFASSRARSPSPTAGTTRPAPATRRVHFEDNQAYAQPPLQQSHQSPARGPVRGRTTGFFRRGRQQPRRQYGPLQSSPQQRQPAGTCQNCARIHPAGMCSAYGQICRACGKRNHFARSCRSTTAALHNVD